MKLKKISALPPISRRAKIFERKVEQLVFEKNEIVKKELKKAPLHENNVAFWKRKVCLIFSFLFRKIKTPKPTFFEFPS